VRARDLPKLIGLWPHELEDQSPEGCRLCWASCAARLGPRDARGTSGHWSYDLNRHLAVVSAYKAELERLLGEGEISKDHKGLERVDAVKPAAS
jgi:hypothetical protein